MQDPHNLALAVLHRPRLLTALVCFMDWTDLYSLLSTCRTLRTYLFVHLPTRDVVLARFVPGYAFCLRHRDMQLYQDVPVAIHDLDMFLISQRTALHFYPTHALRSLTSLSDDPLTAKLIALTQAHSRFVLLLQSLVHSSPLPISHDPPESPVYDSSPSLTFPPPLSFASITSSPPPPPPKQPKIDKHPSTPPPQRPRHSASPYMISTSPSLSHSPQVTRSLSNAKPRRRISIFGPSGLSPLPPPPEDPQTLRIRSQEWRRARSSTSISHLPTSAHKKTHSASAEFDMSLADAYQNYPSDTEFGRLRQPKRLFASDRNANSSSSSISISEARSSWNQGQDSVRSSRSSPPISPQGYYSKVPTPRNQTPAPNPYSPPSIHSILHATIRNRAPVLRVFVPTQHMNLSSESYSSSSSANSSLERSNLYFPNQPQVQTQSPNELASLAIQACEYQLQQAGLWEHLSTGDIVCNFGYIPFDDSEPMITDPVYSPKVLTPSHRASLRSFGPHFAYSQPELLQQQQPLKTWLIFTGDALLPYTPPALLPLPTSSPLSLPSPFYYYHIMPSGMNPLFAISELPRLNPNSEANKPKSTMTTTTTNNIKNNSNVSLSLIQTTSLVPSTRSPTGLIKVKKFSWTARFARTRPPSSSSTMIPISKHHTPNGIDDDNSNKNNSTIMDNLNVARELPPIPQELGDGWLGEWVLEYEGTSEGRQMLLAAAEGRYLGRGKVWEVKRDMSGAGRVWMRLLPE